MESQQVMALVLIDISATFDMVDHHISLEILWKKFGLEGTIMDWFTSYFHDSKGKVCARKYYSDIKTVNFSVPQGGILPPTLFNCYSSIIPSTVLTDIGINAFADDHSLQNDFTPGGPDEITLITNFEQVLKLICHWMNGKRLKMNNKRTKFITLGSRQQLEKFQKKWINVC